MSDAQLSTFIIFGLPLAPLLICFLIHEAFAIRDEIARLRAASVVARREGPR